MNDNGRNNAYALASAPDVVARLRQVIEANETTRVVLDEGLGELADALKLHLDNKDAHLKRLIADLEGRASADV